MPRRRPGDRRRHHRSTGDGAPCVIFHRSPTGENDEAGVHHRPPPRCWWRRGAVGSRRCHLDAVLRGRDARIARQRISAGLAPGSARTTPCRRARADREGRRRARGRRLLIDIEDTPSRAYPRSTALRSSRRRLRHAVDVDPDHGAAEARSILDRLDGASSGQCRPDRLRAAHRPRRGPPGPARGPCGRIVRYREALPRLDQ